MGGAADACRIARPVPMAAAPGGMPRHDREGFIGADRPPFVKARRVHASHVPEGKGKDQV